MVECYEMLLKVGVWHVQYPADTGTRTLKTQEKTERARREWEQGP